MKNLISMTDFVLDCYKNAPIEDYHKENETFVNKVLAYAKFLKQPIKLEMFIPCDEDGNILEEPIEYQDYLKIGQQGIMHWGLNVYNQSKKYKKAKEKVLFEGFTLYPNNDNFLQRGNILIDISKLRAVEDLIPYNVELTDNFKLI
jgi:hypothetical protein